MSDQKHRQDPTSTSPQPDAENKKQSTELSEEELKEATGGLARVTQRVQEKAL
jgi:hypothetical protein